MLINFLLSFDCHLFLVVAVPSGSENTVCDGDSSHVAVFYCPDCDEQYCIQCDSDIHARKKFADHKRKPLAERPRKFSVREFKRGEEKHKSPKAGAFVRSENRGNNKLQFDSTFDYIFVVCADNVFAWCVLLPLAFGDKGGSQYFQSLPADKLKSMGVTELNKVWLQYDRDHNGKLDRREMSSLATDCIARVLKLFEDEVRALNPDMEEEEVQKAIEKEKMFLLPGKNKKETQQEMVKLLIRRLDINNGKFLATSSFFA